MPRYSTKSSSSGGSGGSGLPDISGVVGTSGEAIQSGDVVTLSADDNKLYYALNPDAAGAASRPVRTSAAANDVPLSTTTISAANVAIGRMSSVKLTNGGIAVLAPAASTGYPTLYIYDSSGQLVTAAITVDSSGLAITTDQPTSICQLTNGNVALTYGDQPRYAIYTTAGAVVRAAGYVNVSGNAGFGSLCMTALSGGGFVIAWHGFPGVATPPRKANFMIFNNAGNVVTGVTSADAFTTVDFQRTTGGVALAALSGGGFALGYIVRTAGPTDSTRWRVCDAVGAFVNDQAQGATSGGVHCVDIAAMTDGGFAVISWSAGGTTTVTHRLVKYDAAGNVAVDYGNIDYGVTNLNAYRAATVTPLAAGAFAAIYERNGGITVQRVSSAGTVQSSTQASTTGPLRAATEPSGDVLVGCATAAGGTSKVSRMALATGALTALATGLAGATDIIVQALANPVQPAYSNYLIGSSNPPAFKVVASRIPKLSPLGVANAGYAANAAVNAKISGIATTRLSALTPYTVNAQSDTPPGQKMSWVGTTATLNGFL